MGRIIFVTSFKGGVGKTTVSANIASALVLLGRRVLVVDADYGNRCMDLVLGMEDDCLFDSADAIRGNIDVSAAIRAHGTVPGLYFMPAPAFFGGKLSPDDTVAFFSRLKRDYDFIIVDSSAEDSDTYRAFARAAEDALVVTFHQTTAIRAAEKTAAILSELGYSNIRMVVNCYRAKAAAEGLLPSMYSIIQGAKVQLIGAIPADDSVPVKQESGTLPYLGKGRLSPYEAATLNIAKRLLGAPVPLFKDVYKPKKLKYYF